MTEGPKKINDALRKVLKRLHYPIEVMLVCVRWYAAYPLSLRNLEEMMAERGVAVDHTTVHRWAVKMLPILAAVMRRRKRHVGSSWRMDETYIRIGGQWKYLYRAVDKAGHTIDFCCARTATTLQPEASSSVRWIFTACPRRSPSTKAAPTRRRSWASVPTRVRTSPCGNRSI